jgi:hypothetical protein
MRTTSLGSACVVVLAAFAAACASPNRVDERPLISQQEVDSPPHSPRCQGGYAASTPGAGDVPAYLTVDVPVTVAADGTVESVGTPQIVRNTADAHNLRLTSSARDEARYRAESCVFQPALLLGVAVSARFVLTFEVRA